MRKTKLTCGWVATFQELELEGRFDAPARDFPLSCIDTWSKFEFGRPLARITRTSAAFHAPTRTWRPI